MSILPKVGRAGLAIAGLALVTTLASCGGSDDGSPQVAVPVAASNTPPASASADIGGFIAYVKTVVASSSDTASPIDIPATFVAPKDDTAAFDTTI